MPRSTDRILPALMTRLNGVVLYTIAVPVREACNNLIFNEAGMIPVGWRVTRRLDAKRVTAMTTGLRNLHLPLSAPLACIDAALKFVPLSSESTLGHLHVPSDAKFILVDGQHRISALKDFIRKSSDSIPLHVVSDPKLRSCQDIYEKIHLRSHGIENDRIAKVTQRLATECPIFTGFVDWRRSALSPRSAMLFTLSALTFANRELLRDYQDTVDDYELASSFWIAVDKNIPDWENVRSGKMTAGALRAATISSHGVVLQAMGRAAAPLLASIRRFDPNHLLRWSTLDWSRGQSLWEGAAIMGGKVWKSSLAISRTSEILRNRLNSSG